MSWHVITARSLLVLIAVSIGLLVVKEIRLNRWWKRHIEAARVKPDYKCRQ